MQLCLSAQFDSICAAERRGQKSANIVNASVFDSNPSENAKSSDTVESKVTQTSFTHPTEDNFDELILWGSKTFTENWSLAYNWCYLHEKAG